MPSSSPTGWDAASNPDGHKILTRKDSDARAKIEALRLELDTSRTHSVLGR